jgi:rsbT co-antagonist protein RsbR
MELSTPVLRLWHQILLLPLVGVIDTGRARQITDHLLEAIAKYEARVTVIDLTGVPIIDTSVAQHIMKTIDAARLLGSRVVLTGISPEGAQTLTKLGIRFGDVISRASLRAGIAEALLITGKRIAAMEAGPR